MLNMVSNNNSIIHVRHVFIINIKPILQINAWIIYKQNYIIHVLQNDYVQYMKNILKTNIPFTKKADTL